MPRMRLMLASVEHAMPVGWVVRRAVLDDVPAATALNELTQGHSDLTAGRPAHWWRWLVEYDADEEFVLYVAERDGEVLGTAFMGKGPPGLDSHVTALREIAGRHGRRRRAPRPDRHPHVRALRRPRLVRALRRRAAGPSGRPHGGVVPGDDQRHRVPLLTRLVRRRMEEPSAATLPTMADIAR